MRRMQFPDDPREDTPGSEGGGPADGAAGARPGPGDAGAGSAPRQVDESIASPETGGWEQPSASPSAWVGFWPHRDPPTAEEVGRSIAGWVGREVKAEPADLDDEGMIWAMLVEIPGVTSPVVFWAERALPADPSQLPDPAMAACTWVIGMQTMLEPGEASEEFFHLMAMLSGSMPDLAGVLDVANARRWPRKELEEQFLAADAVPNDEHLWTITAVADRDDDDAPMMLFTTGLARCGLPELEILEFPSRHSQAAAILVNHVASLLLESPPPPPFERMEVGPDTFVALVPWQSCAQYMDDGTPGSRAFREIAAQHGDGSLTGVRAVICSPEQRGQFRKVWAWPEETLARMEDGRAVLYASERAAAATERRAQRTWPVFATAFASVRRSDRPEIAALAASAFHVQAGVGTVDEQDRREQGWFVVRSFDHDVVEAALAEEPVTAEGMHAGDVIRIPRASVSDWRVILPDEMFGPDRSGGLLEAIDRLRGYA
jgi:uncharacterized protein YegJ (DUF2314 family)